MRDGCLPGGGSAEAAVADLRPGPGGAGGGGGPGPTGPGRPALLPTATRDGR